MEWANRFTLAGFTVPYCSSGWPGKSSMQGTDMRCVSDGFQLGRKRKRFACWENWGSRAGKGNYCLTPFTYLIMMFPFLSSFRRLGEKQRILCPESEVPLFACFSESRGGWEQNSPFDYLGHLVPLHGEELTFRITLYR